MLVLIITPLSPNNPAAGQEKLMLVITVAGVSDTGNNIASQALHSNKMSPDQSSLTPRKMKYK